MRKIFYVIFVFKSKYAVILTPRVITLVEVTPAEMKNLNRANWEKIELETFDPTPLGTKDLNYTSWGKKELYWYLNGGMGFDTGTYTLLYDLGHLYRRKLEAYEKYKTNRKE
ncbi:hypothetical protein [Candidatus Uabimicrobium sp. HlEnr_7]|uniref:hypothetical protein n=1 Tax=Candidatus Uabimicrobium helgolandensis TaxID=3095367 RepID=UPI003558EE46